MFEIYDAHRVLFDTEGFFHHLADHFARQLRVWQARTVKDHVWEVRRYATTGL